ncbi:hypothetical protein AAFH96_07780 [Polymorphospora sp. 2-325]|uniref:Uncharacterized protein n=1 Tax=Polymorphospora lycopeni TaxID=3140240 RepID=A0ABV5CLY1_9ACTN
MALIMATCVAASTLAAPPATAQPSGLSLKSLSFASKRVDVREQSVAVTLTWTVRNTNPEAEYLSGSVRLRMAGSTPGTYVGTTRDINFWLYTSWEGVRHVSGNAQESTYEYDFAVPRYGKTTSALWVVAGFNASDDKGATLSLEGAQLARHRPWLKAQTAVDSTPPVIDSIEITGSFPYAYVGDRSISLGYRAGLRDSQAGFWKGTLRLAGPNGQVLTAPFEANLSVFDTSCRPSGFSEMSCQFLLDVPAGTTSGAWQVVEVTLVDNVDNQTTVVPPDTAPITLTSNEVVSAANFTATPNPVNNWTQNATTRLRMDVTGAQNGVGTVQLDFDTPGCRQDNAGPVVDPDGGISVGVLVSRNTAECVVTRLIMVDGAGNAAVYGDLFGAPDPGLTINRLPNTTPPAVSAATLTPTTVTRSEAPNVWPTLTMQVTAPIAPVNQYALYLYDAAGNIVAQQSGGTSGAGPDGTLRLYGYLPYDIAAGTYSYGFTLYDASGLRSSYGVNGQPLAGGPLEITVTDD